MFIFASTDRFFLKNVADVGEITAIALKRDEGGLFPNWQLARVSKKSFFFAFLPFSV